MYLDYTISASKTQYTFETRTCKKQTFRGIFFLFTPQNPARHERCDCCGIRHSAPGPPKMRPSRFIATLYYYSLFFFSILFNFINSQLFSTKLVLIFYRKCVIMPRLKVFIRSPQQRHKLLRFTPVGRKKNDHPPCGSYNRSEISPDMPVFRHVSGKIFPSESFSRPLCLRVPALPNRSTPKRLKDIERITALCSVTLS